MEPTSFPIIAYVIRGGACIGVSCGCLVGLLRAKYKDDLRRESQKHRIAKDRSSGRSSMLSAPLIACKPERLVKLEEPDDSTENPATEESTAIFAACVPVEVNVEEKVKRVSPRELFQTRPPLEKEAPDLSRLEDMSDKLDEKAFLRILKSLVAEAKYLQNDPELDLVPEEWRAAQLVRDELDCFAQHGYGPLVIEEYTHPRHPNRPNLSITYRSQDEIEGSIAFAGVHLDVAAVPKEEQPPGNVVGCCRWCWKDKMKPFKMVQQGDEIMGWATSACLGHIALLTLFLLELAVKKPKLKHEIVVLFFAGREGGEADIGADLVLEHVVKRQWTDVLADPRRSSVFWLGVGNSGLCYGSTGSLSWTLKAETPNERALELIAEALSYIRECFEERFKPLAAEDRHCFTHSSRLKPKVVESKGKVENKTGDDQLEVTKAEAHGEIYVTPFYSTDDVIAALEEFVDKINSDLKHAEHRSRRDVQAGSPSGRKRNWSVFVQAPRKLGHQDMLPRSRRPSLSVADGSADLVPSAPSRGPAVSMADSLLVKDADAESVAAPAPRRHSVSLPLKGSATEATEAIDSSINDLANTVKENFTATTESFVRQTSAESSASEPKKTDREVKAKLKLIWQGRRIDIDSDEDKDEAECVIDGLSEEEQKTREEKRKEKEQKKHQRKEDVCRFAHDLEGVAVDLKSSAHHALKQALAAVCDEEPEPFSIIGCVPHARRWKDQGFDVQLSGFGLLDSQRRWIHTVERDPEKPQPKNEHCLLSSMQLGYKVLMHIVCYLEEDFEHRLEETAKILREMEEEYPFVEKVLLSNRPGFVPEVKPGFVPEVKDKEIAEAAPEFQAQFSSESKITTITTEGAESNGSDARAPSSADDLDDWPGSSTAYCIAEVAGSATYSAASATGSAAYSAASATGSAAYSAASATGSFVSGWGSWLAGIKEEEESPKSSASASEFFNHQQPVIAGNQSAHDEAEGEFVRASSDPVKTSASMIFVSQDTDEPLTPRSAPPILIRPAGAQAVAMEEHGTAEDVSQLRKSQSDPGIYATMEWMLQAISEEADTTNPKAAVEVKKEEHPNLPVEVPRPGSLQGIWAYSSGNESYKLTTVGARYYIEQPEEDGKVVSGMLAHDGEWYRGSVSKDDKHWGQIRVRLQKGKVISNFRKSSEHGWQEDIVAELKSTDLEAGYRNQRKPSRSPTRPHKKPKEGQQVDFKVVEKIITITGDRDIECEVDEVKEDQLSPPSRWSPFSRLPSLRRVDQAPESKIASRHKSPSQLPMPTKWTNSSKRTNSSKKRKTPAVEVKRPERKLSGDDASESPNRDLPPDAEVVAKTSQVPLKAVSPMKFVSAPPYPEESAVYENASKAITGKASSSRQTSPVLVPQPSLISSEAEASSSAANPEVKQRSPRTKGASSELMEKLDKMNDRIIQAEQAEQAEQSSTGVIFQKFAASGDAELLSQAPLSFNGTDVPPVVDAPQAEAEITGPFSRQASGDLDDAANSTDAVRTKKSWFSFIVPKSRFHGASTVRGPRIEVPQEEEPNQDLTANPLMKVTSDDRIGSPSLPETDEASSISSPKLTPQVATKRPEELKPGSSNDLEKANEASDRAGAAATNEIDELEDQKFEP